MSVMYKTGKPAVSSSPKGDGSIRVKHREYLFDLNGATNFTLTKIEINPGLSYFTWLSGLASLYESYVFNSLSFDYESVSGTGQSGTVMIAVDFDAADSSPLTKQELMAMQGAVRTAPWQSCIYDAANQNLQKFGIQRYVRSGPIGSNLDIKTYDVGNLFVASSGSSISPCGEVYVTYDITLHTPQPNMGQLLNNYSAKLIATTSTSGAQPYGVAPVVITGGLPISYRDGNSVYIGLPGQYLCVLDVIGSGIEDSDVWTINAGGSGASLTFLSQASTSDIRGIAYFIVKTTTYNQFFISTLPGATTITATTLRVAAYNYALG